MARSWSRVRVHRGWLVLHTTEFLDGSRRSFFSLKRTSELKRKFMNPFYVVSPEFASVEDAMAWIDDDAPYKLP